MKVSRICVASVLIAIAQSGTYSLGELAIESISTDYRVLTSQEGFGVDQAGNYHALKGTFTMRVLRAGKPLLIQRALDDVYFRVTRR